MMAHACLPKLSDTEEQLLCGGEAVESERDARPTSEGIASDGTAVGPVRSPFERSIDGIANGGTAIGFSGTRLRGHTSGSIARDGTAVGRVASALVPLVRTRVGEESARVVS